ncbi:uncharacterized protein LOC134727089 [Mytilus trossulus]|uniref:uncharacterized protein LOC134727089 n=1 Tax=Mytilus trossulus TaxID=6551 RepID=UPI0030072F19
MPFYSLKPSNVLYSQDSIASKFRSGRLIGEIRDDILDGIISVKDLPRIKVKLIDGKYVSADNRRLWVLKELERLGHHEHIEVIITTKKMDTKKSERTDQIKIRGGGPGGRSTDIKKYDCKVMISEE